MNIAHTIPGLFLLAIPYVSHSPYACVAFITLSFGFNGSGCLTNQSNSHDLAPNFASTLFSVMNGVATTAGFLSPLVVAHFTKDGVRVSLNRISYTNIINFIFVLQNTISEWKNIFIIGASAYIVPSVVFMIFGSADIQPWNYAKRVDEGERKSELTHV